MPAKPVVLDSFAWSTQTAAEAAFRAILRDSGYGVDDDITDPVHDLMLREVLERHPDRDEKAGPGVEAFYIGRTVDGGRYNVRPDAIGIWIRRVDGTRVDFSYRTAILGAMPRLTQRKPCDLRLRMSGMTSETLHLKLARYTAR
ncbi:DCL family protein [Homoserinibacter gongjuensis]|uniref:DUF3223 domain-containing protein n=1 Tax=Homoserinibacter gongjuensis TaxID=1162968 RepID=A0ABQ6JUW5_9MICO|nr:DCL family protein [Homoserinibacter gongjuensis]GMA91492.1 hypothetical protein GCM10025869_20210 [Homoserinibacter gongjuensis]